MVNTLTGWPGSSARLIIFALATLIGVGLLPGCNEKEIIRYRERPEPVILIFPPADTFLTDNNPTFIWHRLADAVHYQLQVANGSDFVIKSIDVELTDTSYTTPDTLPNGSHFWRVRGDNLDGVWGDWSDAAIRPFYKSDYVNYFELLGETETYGIAQDVLVRNDTAFVADGQADLTVVDVSDPSSPLLMYNIDPIGSDFAKSILINPADTFPYIMIADMDGRVLAVNISDTSRVSDWRLGVSQNLEEIAGFFKADTFWIATVSSFSQRKLSFYQILYTPFLQEMAGLVPDFELTADGMGICVDSVAEAVYIANGVGGLMILNITDVYNPVIASQTPLSGVALSVAVKDGFAFVTCDRAGFFVVDVHNAANPAIATQVNTSGRSKDVHIVGDYAFIADASGGLKALDISAPESTHFVAAYATPYAYGIYADAEYIYICDRDRGLMIFENRTSQ